MKITAKQRTYVYVLATMLGAFVLYTLSAWLIKKYGGPNVQGFANADGVDTFSLYYAEWCPHCKTIKPVFAEYSSSGSTKVNGKTVFLTMLEADKDAEKIASLAAPVKGYPTFLLHKSDGTFVEFTGDRSPSGWNKWLQQNV